MPTDQRFDDLDLREEPERGDNESTTPSGGLSNPCNTLRLCSNNCTASCCTTC